MSALPDLGLHAELETPDGQVFRWDANDRIAANRPQAIGFGTKLMDGFADGGLTLPRDSPVTWADLNLYDTFRLIGADGTIAYEGRNAAIPADIGDTKRIGVTTAGWMSHARDRKFRGLYVNRSFDGWGPVSAQRRANLIGGSFAPFDPQLDKDETTGQPALRTMIEGVFTLSTKPDAEAWYSTHDLPIGSLYWAAKRAANIDYTDLNWFATAALSTDDVLTTIDQTADILTSAGPWSGTLTATDPAKTFAMAQAYYNGAGGVENGQWPFWWTVLALYGTQGLTKQGAGTFTDPPALLVTDILRHIAQTYCPLLDASGITAAGATTTQAAWLDLAYPYDAWLALNRQLRWQLAVWEGRKLVYEPIDLSSADWLVRNGERGTIVKYAGPAITASANGITVTYQDANTGTQVTLTPDDDATLADTSTAIAANRAGVQSWQDINLTGPVPRTDAIDIARTTLAAFNATTQPGRAVIRGHIRDAQNTLHPGHAVRAGRAVVDESDVDARPRLIHETRWDNDTRTLTLTLDAPATTVDAVLDQVMTGRQAA